MKKYLFVSVFVFSIIIFGGCNIQKSSSENSYAEYGFDLGDDSDLGFTKRAFEQMEKDQDLQSNDSLAIEDQVMTYIRPSEKDLANGILERYTWGEDTYELRQKPRDIANSVYQIFHNGQLLFEESMDFSAEGPIQDWRIVDGKPAFTFYAGCTYENNYESCSSDIWYDGYLVSEKFSVQNPRYLFSYNGKLGFVATNSGKDSIFYDGAFITPGFTTIWTHNCCAMLEILPTVYENGTLLFYARRDGKDYIVETALDK